MIDKFQYHPSLVLVILSNFCFSTPAQPNDDVINLRIHWRLLMILKTTNESAWSNIFLYVEVCMFWECVQYTKHWDKTEMLKKFPSVNGTKNALFFLSQAPTHHSFTFNLQFLYELKHMVCLSKTMSGIFHFWLCFVLIKVYNFVQQNAWALSL